MLAVAVVAMASPKSVVVIVLTVVAVLGLTLLLAVTIFCWHIQFIYQRIFQACLILSAYKKL
jgi:hypothetical protein